MSSIDINNWVLQALHYPHNLASESELNEHANAALSAFSNADVDSSKLLTVPELRNLCFEMGLPMENDEEEALMKIDADDSGQITIDEWIIWWLKRVSSLPNPVKQQEAIARSTFQRFDVDKSNFLDIVELQELLKCLGVSFSPIEMDEVCIYICICM
jgi:Ca2+-binding EF-hand superfamily protein